MTDYILKPVHVSAAQWDGTKENAKAIIDDMGLNHNEMTYDGADALQSWSTGTARQSMKKVNPNDFLVLNSMGQLAILTTDQFNNTYQLP